MKLDDLPATSTPVAGAPSCLRELGSIRIFSDPWLGNYFVTDPATRNFESFETLAEALAYALILQSKKVELGHPSRYGAALID